MRRHTLSRALFSMRRVYIDAGANWGDTLDSYQHFASPLHRHANNWEIYAFDASPLLMPFLDATIRWRNREPNAQRPISCIPPVGSTEDMEHFIKPMNCTRNWMARANYCIGKKLEPIIAQLEANLTLMSEAVVQQRLDVAKSYPLPADAQSPRFTFIPSAVGGAAGAMGAAKISTYLFTKYSYLPSYLNLPSVRRITNETERRRRAIQLVREDYLATQSKRKHLAVRITDLVGWMQRSFTKSDYVVLKLDVEGAEHAILREMERRGAFELVDAFAWECHSTLTPKELKQLRAAKRPPNDPKFLEVCDPMGTPSILKRLKVNEVKITKSHGSQRNSSAYFAERVEQWRSDVSDPRCAELSRSVVGATG